LSPHSVRTGACCKARERLPMAMVTGLAHTVGALVSARARPAWRWRGRNVKLVDGTGISMPDTAENQACFPQPSSQAAGAGFPLEVRQGTSRALRRSHGHCSHASEPDSDGLCSLAHEQGPAGKPFERVAWVVAVARTDRGPQVGPRAWRWRCGKE